MPHRIIAFVDGHVAELSGAFLLAMQWCVSFFLLSTVPEERYEILEWTLLTGFGAATASFVCFCFSPQREVRMIIMGRCVVALGVGVIGARFVSMFHPWILKALTDPFIRIGGGSVMGFLGYLLALPFTRRSYQRAGIVANQMVQAGEDRLVKRVVGEVVANAAIVAAPLAAKVEEVKQALVEKQTAQLPPHVEVTIQRAPSESQSTSINP